MRKVRKKIPKGKKLLAIIDTSTNEIYQVFTSTQSLSGFCYRYFPNIHGMLDANPTLTLDTLIQNFEASRQLSSAKLAKGEYKIVKLVPDNSTQIVVKDYMKTQLKRKRSLIDFQITFPFKNTRLPKKRYKNTVEP